ncbi:MAG: hypothetical protein HQK66_15045 [Desulfamplus sp.]|nr:hypothetical protein [Desulfamplus sp.]
MNQNIKFEKVYELINSEGAILALVEESESDGQLYIQGLCLNNNTKIYTKVTDSALKLYLLGRITLRELFSLRGDDAYLLVKANKLEMVYIEDEENSKIMNSIECGNAFYPAITAGMRSPISVDEILARVNSEWIRSVAEVPKGRMSENNYLKA